MPSLLKLKHGIKRAFSGRRTPKRSFYRAYSEAKEAFNDLEAMAAGVLPLVASLGTDQDCRCCTMIANTARFHRLDVHFLPSQAAEVYRLWRFQHIALSRKIAVECRFACHDRYLYGLALTFGGLLQRLIIELMESDKRLGAQDFFVNQWEICNERKALLKLQEALGVLQRKIFDVGPYRGR